MQLVTTLREQIRRYPFAKQFIKFCVVGTTSAIVHFSLLYGLTEGFQIWYVYSNGVGFVVSCILNFVSNKLWTFRNTERGSVIVRQVVKFSVVLGVGLVLNTILIFTITEHYGLDYRLSWFIAASIIAFWNFSLNRFWTFRLSPSNPLDLPKM